MSSRDRNNRSPRRSDLRLPPANQSPNPQRSHTNRNEATSAGFNSTEDQIRSLRESLVRNRQYPIPQPESVYDEDEIYQTDTYETVDSWDDDYVEVAPERASQPRRQSSPRQQFRAQPDPEPYDDWNEDEYSEEDDGQGWYEDEAPAPLTRSSRRANTRPQVRVLSLSRPSLPLAISNADIVNDRQAMIYMGTGVVGLIALAALVANRANTLDPQFATHVSASGILEDFKTSRGLWLLPLMATMVMLMNLVIAWFVSPIDRFASRFVLGAALVVQFMVWVAVLRIL